MQRACKRGYSAAPQRRAKIRSKASIGGKLKMPVITRQQIKRVENSMRDRRGIPWPDGVHRRLRGLGFPMPTIPPSSTPPIQGTSTNNPISFSDFWGLITGQIGQLKIEATQFAEGMVRTMYGLEPDMRMPSPGIPVIPNNQNPSFAAASVAGMIERCRLTEAQSALNAISSEFQSRMNNSSDPIAPYIKRWWDQYGRNDISNLSTKIVSGRGTCGVVGEIPKLCTAPAIWCTPKMMCTLPEMCTSSESPFGNTSTIMMLAAFGLAAMLIMRR